MVFCVLFFFSEFQNSMKTYVVGTHLNCIDKSMQFKWVQKYTGCNLKTMKFLDCALIGVCAVIKWNTVGQYFGKNFILFRDMAKQ